MVTMVPRAPTVGLNEVIAVSLEPLFRHGKGIVGVVGGGDIGFAVAVEIRGCDRVGHISGGIVYVGVHGDRTGGAGCCGVWRSCCYIGRRLRYRVCRRRRSEVGDDEVIGGVAGVDGQLRSEAQAPRAAGIS